MFPFQNGIDPSQLDPKVLKKMSDLVQTLPPEMLMKMQGLMQKSMTGVNVQNEMMEFERALPENFRSEMAKVMYAMNGVDLGSSTVSNTTVEATAIKSNNKPIEVKTTRDARMTVLYALYEKAIGPDEAYDVLFND